MEVVLLSVNKTRDPALKTLISSYLSRINHYVKFSMVEIPKINYSNNNKEEQKNKEAIEIKKKMTFVFC